MMENEGMPRATKKDGLRRPSRSADFVPKRYGFPISRRKGHFQSQPAGIFELLWIKSAMFSSHYPNGNVYCGYKAPVILMYTGCIYSGGW